jgi:arsenate reductase-like glutaredoxin family protein
MQIIGTRKCKETAKALRFCKERSIDCQFVDLGRRSLSPGEWDSIFSGADETALLDTASPYYVKNGYAYREFSVREELVEHPQLLKTPIIRHKGKVCVGLDPQTLLDWGMAR